MGTVRASVASLASLAILSTALVAAPARAQSTAPTSTMPSGTLKADPATKGSTDIAKGGFVATNRPDDEDPSQATELSIGAGGLLTSGNSRTIAITSLGKFRMRRDEHQFSTALAANFARAGKVGTETDTTVSNYQALLRYDYFITDKVSLFLQSTARRDKFQGLDLRLNIDPGIAYYFIDTKKHRLQAEIGYDFQYDDRRDASLQQPVPDGSPPGTLPPPPLDKTQVLHNSRLFVGYDNKLRKEVSFLLDVEYIQNYADTDVWRLVGDIGLKSTVADNLALATTYTLRYENHPLPNIVRADSIASFTFIYTFF